MRTCSVEDCSKPHKAKSFCRGHYQIWRKENSGPCVIEGCVNPGSSGGGYCITHYGRRWKGRPMDDPVVPHIKKEERINEEGERLCTRCRTYLPLNKFRKTGTKYGLAVYCNRCAGLYSYNIDRIQYDELWESQGKACAACRVTDPGAGREWHIGHDHACCPSPGKSCGRCIRNILCYSCNVILGYAKDNPETLVKLSDYLVKHQTQR